MKYIFTIAMCLASLLSCNSTKNTEDTNKPSVSNKTLQPLPNTIEVETVARGLYKNVVITNGIAIFKADRTDVGTTVKLTKEQLQALKLAYNEFELDRINEYLSTTEKRFSDASAASSIKIINNNVEYVSNDFDTSNPPIEFSTLIKTIGTFLPKK
nr:hypothetical protein [uncultured Flavobacterium sp.]